MGLTNVSIVVPDVVGGASAWAPSPLVVNTGISLRGPFQVGDRITIYGTADNTIAVTAGVQVGTVTVATGGTLSVYTPREWESLPFLAAVRSAGTSTGVTLVISGDDSSTAIVVGPITVNQGTSPWIVSGTTVVSGPVSVTQGTSPWVTVFASPQHIVVDSGSVSATQGTSPWIVSGAVTVSGTVTSNQGTSPWVTSVSNFPLTQAVTQSTSPWVVSGTVTANQGTSPWITSGTVTGTVTVNQGTSPWITAFSAPQHVIVDSGAVTVSGTVSSTQGTSPWVVSGTVTSNQGGAPWSVTFPSAQHVIVDSVTGTIGVTQSTSPWVVSGTVTANQGGAPWSVTIPTQALSTTVTDTSQATLVQAAITGRTEGGGAYLRTSADNEGHLQVNAVRPSSAVGDFRAAQPTPLVQVLFTYGINPNVVGTTLTGTGSVTGSQALAVVATGASANSAATLATRRYLVFRAGQGARVVFTALYTLGVVGSTQWGGIGALSNGIFFGYQDATFGIMIRTSGVREIQTLTITTASTTNENATVTLEGVAKLVPVTNSGTITTTAREIAAADYSTTGSGWDAYQDGSTVVFLCRSTGNKVGVFSLTATTARGTFVETTAGALPSEAFVPQTAWNVDRCNGAGGLLNPSGINLDPTKMNAYEISGSTNVNFFIQSSLTGEFVLVHEFQYANNFTSAPLRNPNFPVAWMVTNTANTTNVSMSVAGGGAFTDGDVRLLGPKNAARALKTGLSAVVPILTIRNNLTFQGMTNRAQIHAWLMTASSDGTRAVQVIFTVNATLTGAVFQPVDTWSVASVDTSATASTGGTMICTMQLGQTSDELIYPPELIDFFLAPGETLTVSATSLAAADVGVSVNWVEDQ